MKTRFIKKAVYAVTTAALLAGSFSACRMDELADVRPPMKRGNDSSQTKTAPYLESLSLGSEIALEPFFAPNVLTYTAKLSTPPQLSVTITATAASGLVIDYKTGQTFAPSPASPAQIVVSNAEGMSTNYLIVFNAGDAPLPPARLIDIKLSEGTIEHFDPEIFAYPVKVPYGTGEIAVSPIGKDEGSLYTFNPSVTITPVAGETKTVEIGVVSPHHSVGYYKVLFTVDDPHDSRLLRVDLSAGSLIPAFSPEITGYEINVNEGTNPFIVDAVRIRPLVDTVCFIELPGESVLADGPTAVFDSNRHGSFDGKKFKITVYQGTGYRPVDYTFTILTSAHPPALLQSLAFANGSIPAGTLKQGGPDNTTEGDFDPDITTYTLEFAHGTNTAMTAVGQDGVTAESGMESGNQITVNYNPLQASDGAVPPARNFVTINAAKAAHIPTTYTVYFKKTPLPPAALQSLAVYGGTLVNTGGDTEITEAEVQDEETFTNNRKQYSINALANAQAVIVEGTPQYPSSSSITYDPKNFVNNLQQTVPQTISVHVLDGLEYADTTYELTVHVLEAQTPRLESLTINAVPITTLHTSILVYAHTILFNNRPADGKPAVAWTTTSSVSRVEYSFDSGSTWLQDDEKNGFDPTASFTVDYSETKHVLVKLRAADGSEAVYTLIITQEGNPNANLTGIKVYKAATGNDLVPIKQRVDPNLDFAPAVYYYDVRAPNGTNQAYIEPAGPAGSTITYSIDGGDVQTYTSERIAVNNVSIDDIKTVNINVQAQGGGASNTYTLYIKQYASSEALLTSLAIPAGGTMVPADFAERTFYYTYQLPHDFNGAVQFRPISISDGAELGKSETSAGAQPNFTPLPVESYVSVSGIAHNTPKTVSFRVMAQNKINSNIYNFYITKAQNNEAKILRLDASFTLRPDSGPDGFNSEIDAYSSVAAEGNEVKITPESISAGASMSYSVITDNVVTTQQLPAAAGANLQLGYIDINQTKIIIFTVVSEDGSRTNSYTFTVRCPGNENAAIEVLDSEHALTPAFSSTIYNYTLTVPFTAGSTSLNPKKISAGASMTVQVDGAAGPAITAGRDGSITSGSVPVNLSSSSASKLLTFTVTPQSGNAVGIYNLYVTHQAPSIDTNLNVSFNIEQSENGSSYQTYEGSVTAENKIVKPAFQYKRIKITPVFTSSNGASLYYKNNSGVFAEAAGGTGYAASDSDLVVLEPKTMIFQARSQSGAPGAMYTFTIIRQPNIDDVLKIESVTKEIGTGGLYGGRDLNGNLYVNIGDSDAPLSDNLKITFIIPAGAVLYHIDGTSMHVVASSISDIMLGETFFKTLSLMLQPQDTSKPAKLYTLPIRRGYSKGVFSDAEWSPPMDGSYAFICHGASGGTNGSYYGGDGGISQGTITMTKSETLTIFVGKMGQDNAGGANGGGNGSGMGRGGGGATDIRKDGVTLTHRIMVAGGGGGAGRNEKGLAGGGGQQGDGERGEQRRDFINSASGGDLSARWESGSARGNALSSGGNAAGGTESGGGGGGYMGGYANDGEFASFAEQIFSEHRYSIVGNGGGGGSGYVDHSKFSNISGAQGGNTGDGWVKIMLVTPDQ